MANVEQIFAAKQTVRAFGCLGVPAGLYSGLLSGETADAAAATTLLVSDVTSFRCPTSSKPLPLSKLSTSSDAPTPTIGKPSAPGMAAFDTTSAINCEGLPSSAALRSFATNPPAAFTCKSKPSTSLRLATVSSPIGDRISGAPFAMIEMTSDVVCARPRSFPTKVSIGPPPVDAPTLSHGASYSEFRRIIDLVRANQFARDLVNQFAR